MQLVLLTLVITAGAVCLSAGAVAAGAMARTGEWREPCDCDRWRTYRRVRLLARLGALGLPVLVLVLGLRDRLSPAGAVAAGLVWVGFALLARWLRRPRARRAAAGAGTPTPS